MPILLLLKVLVLFLLLLKLELLKLLLPDFLLDLLLLAVSNLILEVLLLLKSILKPVVVVVLTVEIRVRIRRSLQGLLRSSLGLSRISILPLVIENVVLEVIPEFLLLALLLLLVKVELVGRTEWAASRGSRGNPVATRWQWDETIAVKDSIFVGIMIEEKG